MPEIQDGTQVEWSESSSVLTASIVSGSIDTADLAAGAVTTVKLDDGAVTNAKMAANAVDTAELVADAVTTVKIAADAVTNAKIGAAAVDTTELADGAVTDAKVDTGIDAAKLADGSVSNTELQYLNGVTSGIQTQFAGKLSLSGGTMTGNIILAAGIGLDFSATANSSGTMTSELFDDYEEGTWVASYSFATSGSATTSSDAAYVKIGKVVVATFQISTSSLSSPTGDATISGLPFVSENVAGQRSAVAIGQAQSFGSAMTLRAFVDNDSSAISLRKNAVNASEAIVQGSDFQAGVGQNRMVGVAVYVAS